MHVSDAAAQLAKFVKGDEDSVRFSQHTGRHGLLISKRNARGLLLPQVATTYGWTRERFLQETCRKAGLRPDDWKDGATIECFSALVFGEKQFHFSVTT